MSEIEKLTNQVKRLRDEARLKVTLGSKELRDEMNELEARWKDFEEKAALAQSKKEIGDTLKMLGAELKTAYERIHKAL